MNELISPDHRSSGNGWADQLTAYRQRTRGRSRGLERDASEICVFELPVAVDTSSGAALSPSFSLRDVSGATAVRYLSSEAGECVGENNESSRTTPSHRYPMQGAFAVAAPETPAAVGTQTARTQANRRSQVRKPTPVVTEVR